MRSTEFTEKYGEYLYTQAYMAAVILERLARTHWSVTVALERAATELGY